jgi:hypothetical protein
MRKLYKLKEAIKKKNKIGRSPTEGNLNSELYKYAAD